MARADHRTNRVSLRCGHHTPPPVARSRRQVFGPRVSAPRDGRRIGHARVGRKRRSAPGRPVRAQATSAGAVGPAAARARARERAIDSAGVNVTARDFGPPRGFGVASGNWPSRPRRAWKRPAGRAGRRRGRERGSGGHSQRLHERGEPCHGDAWDRAGKSVLGRHADTAGSTIGRACGVNSVDSGSTLRRSARARARGMAQTAK